jgi:hypothetical protein
MLGLYIKLIILNQAEQKPKPHHYNNEYSAQLIKYQTLLIR